MSTQINGSVLKAFSILELFTPSRHEITTAIICNELGMNMVTAHRFVRTLEQIGVLVAVSRGHYRLGFVLVDLGDRATHHTGLGRILQPVLDEITHDVGEACMATIFEADKVVCIARAVTSRPLFVDIRIGTRFEAYCTANGKLWLANMSEHEFAQYLDNVVRPVITSRTLSERAVLTSEIARVRTQDFAVNDREREEDISAIAVPVRTRAGRLVATLSVFTSSTRMTEALQSRALERLRKAAKQAERVLYGEARPLLADI